MKAFEGKVAIISGATSGLGRSIAIEFAKKERMFLSVGAGKRKA